MTDTEVRRRFEQYQETRNYIVAKLAYKSEKLKAMSDEDVSQILDIMTTIYDLGYRKAINDCLSIENLEYPNTERN